MKIRSSKIIKQRINEKMKGKGAKNEEGIKKKQFNGGHFDFNCRLLRDCPCRGCCGQKRNSNI
jgi:hypothetical protein